MHGQPWSRYPGLSKLPTAPDLPSLLLLPSLSLRPSPCLSVSVCLSLLHAHTHIVNSSGITTHYAQKPFWGKITIWSCGHELPLIEQEDLVVICTCFFLWLFEDLLKYFVMSELLEMSLGKTSSLCSWWKGWIMFLDQNENHNQQNMNGWRNIHAFYDGGCTSAIFRVSVSPDGLLPLCVCKLANSLCTGIFVITWCVVLTAHKG